MSRFLTFVQTKVLPPYRMVFLFPIVITFESLDYSLIVEISHLLYKICRGSFPSMGREGKKRVNNNITRRLVADRSNGLSRS